MHLIALYAARLSAIQYCGLLLILGYISSMDEACVLLEMLSETFWSAEDICPEPKFLQKYWSWTNIFPGLIFFKNISPVTEYLDPHDISAPVQNMK